MKMPPLWKVRREIFRPIHQLLNLPNNLFTYLFGALYFDYFKKIQKFNGMHSLGEKPAIFVIFSKNHEVKASHLRTLTELNENGYSVIVVSNSPLNASDIQRLQARSSQVILRPNFGYDFGAYRQGILFLFEQKIKFSRLLLLNDSCWFPTLNGISWIRNAENEELDLVGVASNYGIDRKWGQNGLPNSPWKYSSSHKNFHYCSFALLFSKSILHDSSFLSFWKRFPLTNKKSKVVRRGEIGLTRLIIKAGFSHGETFKIATLPDRLKKMEYRHLLLIFSNLIIPEDKDLQNEYTTATANMTLDRSFVEKFILKSVARQGAAYGLAYLMNAFEETPFLKKSPFFMNPISRASSMKCLEILPENIANEILDEIN
jgi:lipopolysaccharide biosynthesis protein